MQSAFPFLVLLAATGGSLLGQAPPGYYASADTSSEAALRSSLHEIIDDHTIYPYTAGGTDTWNILEWADEDPANSSRIVDVYLNESYAKQGGGNSFYNREHTWPSSYGFPDGAGTGPYTDCHSLRLVNDSYNSSRSNKPFDDCNAGCDEEVTVVTNGTGGGSGVFPGNSNWTDGLFTGGRWQCWAGRKGDVARSLLYMDIRYNGGTHGGTGLTEPDLILTDNRNLIAQSNTGQDELTAYMGILSVVVQWHWDDPPDANEIERNDRVYFYQGNRNPFVDHPEWVDTIWGGGPGGPIPGTFTRYGTGCPSSTLVVPSFAEIVDPRIGDQLLFLSAGAPPSTPGAVHLGFSQTSVNLGLIGFPACNMLAPPDLAFGLFSNVIGLAFTTVGIPADSGLVGTSLYSQMLFAEFGIPLISTTQGGQITLGTD